MYFTKLRRYVGYYATIALVFGGLLIPIATMIWQPSVASALTFPPKGHSPDDRRVFITAGRNQVRDPAGGWSAVGGGVWELPAPDAWADVLCAKLTANPTHDQWKTWITDDPTIGYRELCPNKAASS